MVPSDPGGGETGILKKKPGVTRAKPLDSICRFHRSRGEGDGWWWGWPWGESETGGPNPHQLVLQPASGGSRGNYPVSSSPWWARPTQSFPFLSSKSFLQLLLNFMI
ncbi:hypothetical protein CRENBAI_015788 [Crenichthys baileyi]|uniref:Uncharacterized protein n=1 Tax=Crenichthys baileyi TaxID=28760 RepID=A0AAV9RJG4_9TELE